MKKAIALFLFASSINLSAQTEIPLNGEELFGDLQARQIGPALMSGRVSDIEGHPSNSSVIYIGTAGGGVWKSNDGGVVFNSIFDDYCQSIGCVKVDPNDPDNTIWVGTGETWTRNSTSVGNGIYKSTDGGKNWKHMGLPNSDRIASIEIDPKNSNVVYAGVLGAIWGDSEERGVYKSNDGGQTWTNILFIDKMTGCSDLIMDPNDPNTLYASFWEARRTAWSFNSGGYQSALYKTIDGGLTWKKIHTGFPTGKLGRIGIAVSPSNPNIVYSVIECEKENEKGLYRSDDGGANWKQLNNDFGLTVRPFYFSRLVVDPKNPNTVVKAGLFGSISKDGGKTFKNLGSMHSDIHDIWFDINDSDKIFAATDGGLYRSLNGGTTMEIIENLPLSQFYHVAVDNNDNYQVYGGLQDNGSWFGPSRSPGGIEARDWETCGYGDGFRVYPHPTKDGIVYSEMQGAEAIWRYDDNRKQTRVIKPFPVEGDPKLRFNWNAAITTSQHHPDRLYVGSQFLHMSDDMGDTWVKISPDLTTNDPAKQNQVESGGLSKDNSGAENHCTIFTIGESPIDDKVIWIGTDDGNVQVTFNGGKSWSNVTANITGLPKNTWCYHIEASSFDKNTAYAVFDGHTKNDKTTYVYKTIDGGKTWKSIVTDQIDGFARSFQEDFENENLLFLGTELGLYVTLDGGSNWTKFTNNVPATAIHYMDMHKGTSDLVMGTHGRGIIILDDVSVLRQVTPSILTEKLHFFETPVYTMDEQSTFGGTSSEVQFVGPNPSTAAQIKYYLSKRHTFGKMTMVVQDMEGNYITTLNPGKKKGINVVDWYFNSTAPKIANGKTFVQAGMASPRVPAGKYKVIITKGKDTFETVIEVAYDSNSLYSLKDREAYQKASKELYDMNEELAYMVYEIDERIKHISSAMESNKSIQKMGAKYINDLEELKSTLVITTGDNYVGAAEKQLRERIGDLYATVVSNVGPPTFSQLENLKFLTNDLKKAKDAFDKVKSTHDAKYQKLIEKYEIKEMKLQSFEEFTKKG